MMLSHDEQQKRLARLRRFPLFSSIDEENWLLVSKEMKLEQFEADDRIISAGEESSDLFWIDEGTVSVFRDTPFGVQPIADLKEGSLFGELSLIDGRGRSTDVQALTRTQIWRVNGPGLIALFDDNPPLACMFYRYFWSTLAQKINLANGQLQRFFAGESAPASPESSSSKSPHARPAWFAPPDNILSDSSSAAFSAVGSSSVSLAEDEKRKALEQVGLAPPEIELLFKLGEEVALPQNEPVFHEGDFGDTLYFILSGSVRITKKIAGIGEEALAILEVGQFFGEMALVSDNAVRSADCHAHEGEVVLLAFRLHMLNTLEGHAEHDFPFLQALCKMMTHRLREINEKLFSWKMMSGGF